MTHPHAMPVPESPHDHGCPAHPHSSYAYIGSELDCTCGADRTRYVLPASADTSPEYPTRCPDCSGPVQRLSVFPGGRCITCHEAVTPPVTDAAELVRMWGGDA